MILQSLVRYYEDLLQQNDKKPVDERIPKLGWCLAGVSYMIELKEDGTIKQIISLKEEKKYGKKMVWKPQIFCVPEMLSRSGKCPPSYFLCDNAKYLMGINIEGTNSDIKDRFLFSDIYLTESRMHFLFTLFLSSKRKESSISIELSYAVDGT